MAKAGADPGFEKAGGGGYILESPFLGHQSSHTLKEEQEATLASLNQFIPSNKKRLHFCTSIHYKRDDCQ